MGTKDVPCSRCGSAMWRTKYLAEFPVCQPCRRAQPAPYKPSAVRLKRNRKGYAQPKRHACSECGAAMHLDNRRKDKAKPLVCRPCRSVPKLSACEICESEFIPTSHSLGKYCSRDCAAAGLRTKPVATPFACIVPWGECLSCGSLIVARNRKYCSRACLADGTNAARSSFFVYFLPCAMCGDLFTSQRVNAKRCDECRVIHRRAERAKWRSTSDYDSAWLLLHVGPRDSWKCGICGKQVKRRHYDVTDKYSPTIDHIIPRNEGGTHDLANLRLAHMVCNSLRADRGGGEQLALIG